MVAPLLQYDLALSFLNSHRDADLRAVELAGGPTLQPYQGLAESWDEYTARRIPNYPDFLRSIARRRGLKLDAVLDLACGTGLLTERFAQTVPCVVGLDASEAMLAGARARCGDRPGVEFVRSDFRDFSVGRQFDAVVCASNSLNYVADRAELRRVFAAVSRHLRPGGLFAFDTTTEKVMSTLNGQYLYFDWCGHRFALRFSYDRSRRLENSLAILPSGIETHRRIPLDSEDVFAAAEGTGLREDDRVRSWVVHGAAFFVLTKSD